MRFCHSQYGARPFSTLQYSFAVCTGQDLSHPGASLIRRPFIAGCFSTLHSRVHLHVCRAKSFVEWGTAHTMRRIAAFALSAAQMW